MDEYVYYEVFVYFIFVVFLCFYCIFILGGGDGLVLWEVFKYKEVKEIDFVEIDVDVVNVVMNVEELKKLN